MIDGPTIADQVIDDQQGIRPIADQHHHLRPGPRHRHGPSRMPISATKISMTKTMMSKW